MVSKSDGRPSADEMLDRVRRQAGAGALREEQRPQKPLWQRLLWWPSKNGVTTAVPTIWAKSLLRVSIWCVLDLRR